MFSKKFWNRCELAVKIVSMTMCLLFGVATVGGQIMIANQAAVNYAFNVETTHIEYGNDEEQDTEYYKSEFSSVAEVKNSARDIAEEIMEEGAVLLKNDNNALPLSQGANVSFYSESSVVPVMTGMGSSGINSWKNDGIGDDFVDFKTAFEAKGMHVNGGLWNWYKENFRLYGRQRKSNDVWGSYFSIREAPWDKIPEGDKANASYGDAAIFVLSRNSGEGRDMAMWYGNLIGSDAGDLTANNYLALSPTERGVLQGLKALKDKGTIKNIVVLMNTANPVQCDFVDDAELGIDALIWCGTLGDTGTLGVADLMVGNVNPSGRLSDTFWKYHYLNPVNANFAMDIYDYQANGSKVTWGEKVPKWWLQQQKDNNSDAAQKQNMITNSRSTVYAEGIYVGYRYTETRYEDVVTGRSNVGDFDYYGTVSYPFGYGLSYTTFSYSDFKVERVQRTAEMEDSLYNVSVKVTNAGTVAGKEVVQLYLQKPYTEYDVRNGIEKAAVELVEFGKTGLLQPGESGTIELTIHERDLACYDEYVNKTYILEEGNYFLTVAKDAHEAANNILAMKADLDEKTYQTKSQGNTGEGDAALVYLHNIEKTNTSIYATSVKAMNNNIQNTPTAITNQFETADIRFYDGAVSDEFTYITRADWTDTVKLGFDINGTCLMNQVKVTVTDEMFQDRKTAMNDPEPDYSEYPTYAEEEYKPGEDDDPTHLNLIDLRVYESGEKIRYNDSTWDALLDQLTWNEQKEFLSHAWRLTRGIASIAKPNTIDFNGSVGLVSPYNNSESNNHGLAVTNDDPDKDARITYFPCNGIAASTFNKELMEEYGVQWGEESLWSGCNGLYGMGVNMHRSPYGGRNFEYYSEDPVLMGKIASEITIGAATKGHYMYLKHAIMNDQETYRIGGYVWANEQTIRELYLKPFQIAIEEGGAANIMTAEPALGVNWAGSQGFINSVLRAEFGMTGFAVSDYLRDIDGNFMQGLLGGNDLPDGDYGGEDSLNGNEFANITLESGHGNVAQAMRDSVHRILYTVVHSNAMNGFSSNTRVIVITPAWIGQIKAATVAFTVLFAASAALVLAVAVGRPIVELLQRRKEGKESE